LKPFESILLPRAAPESAVLQRTWRSFFEATSQILSAWARGRLLDPAAGAKDLRDALALYVEQGNKLWTPWFHGLIADLEAMTGGSDAALDSVDAGIALAQETGERWADPALSRRKAEVLLKRDPPIPHRWGSAPERHRHRKGAGSAHWGLRAALSLAKLYQSTARPAAAHAILAPTLEGFSPTPEMPEIAEAQSLLITLAEAEEVKAAEAQRQRRLHLQTAYGQAMMWAKGFSAEASRARRSSWPRPTTLRSALPRHTVNGCLRSCEANCSQRVNWRPSS
jgi:predicted ATPase